MSASTTDIRRLTLADCDSDRGFHDRRGFVDFGEPSADVIFLGRVDGQWQALQQPQDISVPVAEGKVLAFAEPVLPYRGSHWNVGIFRAEIPATFLFPRVKTVFVRNRVRGLSSPRRVDPLRFMDTLWLDDRSQQ